MIIQVDDNRDPASGDVWGIDLTEHFLQLDGEDRFAFCRVINFDFRSTRDGDSLRGQLLQLASLLPVETATER